ncbi:FecR domain-containing protein [Reyranella sp.]|uniref:FecR domain-containing protein n=1 Tax=Reyranella sp. TaxID=1929291 RepID=UPI0025D50AB2|nr:FecR domain-containing protein [Reyranella sp.]
MASGRRRHVDAEFRDLVLEDGSRVALDAGSAIAVDYTASQCSVWLLAGQAFFEDVPSRQRPFVVAASGIDVEIAGTAFNVATSENGVAQDNLDPQAVTCDLSSYASGEAQNSPTERFSSSKSRRCP